jgi:hypothetical protein
VTERDETSKEHEAPEPQPEEPTPEPAPPIAGSMGSATKEAAANRRAPQKPWWQFWKSR